MSQTSPGYSPPIIKQQISYQHGSKSEQVLRSTYVHVRVSIELLHKMFEVLTIFRNTFVRMSLHGFPDTFQLTCSVPDSTKCSYDAFP